ncbi:MAG: methyltransferase domain-containing protein [Bdellovibrionales bacterium]|nr:methyltransferase domain-containing protein [Bdellovibrionales bacterium]
MSDFFSKQAKAYSEYRPMYPEEMYQFLFQQCKGHERAWDCATGNGQAAVALSEVFGSVLATDRSTEQIQYARKKSNIRYLVAKAEDRLEVPDSHFDLVTIAQALHWPNLDG